jgi:aldehyde:ferredoxin oxidoreductase
MGSKAAAILVTTADHYMRAAARGGLGAVMGSKNLKAIVIDGTGGPGVTVADPAALKDAAKTLTTGIHSHPAMAALEALGSAFLVNVTQSMGCLATKNFSAGTYENAQDITGEHMVEVMATRPNAHAKHSCMKGCIINCSQVYTDDAGEVITSGVEFETLGLMGSNCQINDLDQIARLDHLCDDLGLDTMEVGAAMGVAMEGGLLAWGDGDGAHAMLARLTGGDDRGLPVRHQVPDHRGGDVGPRRVPPGLGRDQPVRPGQGVGRRGGLVGERGVLGEGERR